MLEVELQTAGEIELGGISKACLLERLRDHAVCLNAYAEALFASPLFTTSASRYRVQYVVISVGELGLTTGGCMPAIQQRAAQCGLSVCPVELGPFLRLHDFDEPEISQSPSGSGRAPEGAVTVMSEPLCKDHNFPGGFYLRRVDGVLWLRGYCSDDEHVWNPTDRLAWIRG